MEQRYLAFLELIVLFWERQRGNQDDNRVVGANVQKSNFIKDKSKGMFWKKILNYLAMVLQVCVH